ncbi:serine protease [Mesorhizobium huakuii]|uniref:Serine protease n=1 Tax=Mesorhizobium huakuii TaxID=28104 RepID=A0A7G6T6I8_9HYPH|nr:serine protease [Mesorhizobium huakuii]QND62370.1 serine protease [Mesorhizobium huakuii]QND69544.1 serine protease [Mesorhizobium loti]
MDGKPTTIEEHPWQVALLINGNFCGGSVIAERWIVTAAHCLADEKDDVKVEVKVGATDYHDGVSFYAKSFFVHEEYNPDTCEHDVALVRVDSTQPAAIIPLATSSTQIAIGEGLTVSGWGNTLDVGESSDGGEPSDQLLKGTVPYVENETCNGPDSYAGGIFPGMMCAGSISGGTDACQGDSGGPLTKGNSPEDAILVGIVSTGDGCGKRLKYGVYTRVSSEREWILDKMSQFGN